MLVLCADENQPAPTKFQVLKVVPTPSGPQTTYFQAIVVHCPLYDDGEPMRPGEWTRAQGAAMQVAGMLRQGQRSLVTCHAGLNRSGLVTALALHFFTGNSGEKCLEHVQAMRPGALVNEHFAKALRGLRGN